MTKQILRPKNPDKIQLPSPVAPTRRRGGAIMVVAIICLLLTSMLLGSVLKTAIAHRRQVRGEEYRHQAVWLTESAVARAVNRLDADPDYPGETWDVAAKDLGGRDSGRVVIKVTRSAEAVASRTVSIVTTFPVDSTRFARRTREFEFTMQAQP